MDIKLMEKIGVCPKCRSSIKIRKGKIVCSKGHQFSVSDDIAIFDQQTDDFFEGKFTAQYLKPNFKNPFYAAFYTLWFSFSLGARHFRSFARFCRQFRQKGLVLDFGCGGGNINYLKRGKVVGTDISFASLKEAAKLYDCVTLTSGHKMPFADNTFDYVFTSQVFGHIPHDEKDIIIKELYRVSKPGAIFFGTIEADSKGNPWVNLLKKHPKLYQKHWIEMYGHFGLELPSQNIARFKRNGFKLIRAEKGLRVIWEAGGYYILSKGLGEKSLIARFIGVILKPFATILPLRICWDFIAGILSSLIEWVIPIDCATGVIIIAKVDK